MHKCFGLEIAASKLLGISFLPCSSRGSSSAGTTYVILGKFQLDLNQMHTVIVSIIADRILIVVCYIVVVSCIFSSLKSEQLVALGLVVIVIDVHF